MHVPAKTRAARGDRGSAHGQGRDQCQHAEQRQRERERSPARLARGRRSQVAGGGAHECELAGVFGLRFDARGGRGRAPAAGRRAVAVAIAVAVAVGRGRLARARRALRLLARNDVLDFAANVIVGTSSAGIAGSECSVSCSWALRSGALSSRSGVAAMAARAALGLRRGISRSSASTRPAPPSSTSSAAATPRSGFEPPLRERRAGAVDLLDDHAWFLILSTFCRPSNQTLNACAVWFVMSVAFCGVSAVPVILMKGSGPSRKPPAPEKAYGLTALTLPLMRRTAGCAGG